MALVSRYPQRDEVWLLTLDPTQGVEIQKPRPCLVISPDCDEFVIVSNRTAELDLQITAGITDANAIVLDEALRNLQASASILSFLLSASPRE
jgi:hypothetical protein